MHYVEKGEGDPILFLHGQPTSSYLWRNVMPHVEGQGRVVAPDNIGFGKSDQPDLDYVFADHYRYIEAFIKALDLRNITLVLHDWGSGLGLHYARQHPGNVKGIVLMESVVAPFMPAESYDALPKRLGAFLRTLRDPVSGPKLLIDENYLIEDVLPRLILRNLDRAAHDYYRQPFLEKSSRKQINQWPHEVPIGGSPADVAEAIAGYNAWLLETETPLLFLLRVSWYTESPGGRGLVGRASEEHRNGVHRRRSPFRARRSALCHRPRNIRLVSPPELSRLRRCSGPGANVANHARPGLGSSVLSRRIFSTMRSRHANTSLRGAPPCIWSVSAPSPSTNSSSIPGVSPRSFISSR